MKTVLITGASSGIGKETARVFSEFGYRVIATARNVARMQDLKDMNCQVYALDVADEESTQRAFKAIFSHNKTIDILINNAGYSQNGFVEELTMSQLKRQFDVNVFGLIRVTQMVLPAMRNQKEGHIINVGSAGGDFTTPGAGAYHASKYAVESFSDALRQELSAFNIKVSLIKPGGVETSFVDNSQYPEPIQDNPYGSMRDQFLKMVSTILKADNSSFPILKAREVAEAILGAAKSQNPKTRIRVGRTAKMMPVVKTLMSDKAFDNMIMKQLGLTTK